jgi:hypothetical protein
MAMRVPLSARIGVALILTGVALYGGWKWWVTTRTWVPLDIPVSLSRGHIRTSEFEINLEGSFWVYVEVERKFDFEGVPCLLGYGSDSCKKTPNGVVNVSWILSDRGRVVAQGKGDPNQAMLGGTVTMGRGIGRFSADRGKQYVLDVDVLEDGSRLDPGHPRLKIETTRYWIYEEKESQILAFSLFLAAIGVTLLVSSIVARSREKRDELRMSLTAPGLHQLKLRIGTDPTTVHAQPSKSRYLLPLTAWLGLGLLFLGVSVVIVVQYWMDTRTFVPVDMPISLAAGHIRTGLFRINLKDSYSINIDTAQWWKVDPQCVSYNVLQTRWVLYRNGKVVDRHDEQIRDSYGSGFDGEEGVYDLDVEVLADASCLNLSHPRLRIATERREYEF